MNLFNLDKIGVCVSSACAVHCMAVPLILVYSTSLGIFAFLNDPFIEMIILSIALLIGAFAIIPSLIKHRKPYVLVLFLAGVLLIANSEMVPVLWYKLVFSTAGGALMAYAHFENLKLKSSRS